MDKGYNTNVEAIRAKEYPHMNNGVYLDHSGATIYAKSTVEGFARKMVTTLYGNPHSENTPAQASGTVVDEVREKALRFLGADPENYDLVFVANATAAIKLVGEAFRDLAEKTRARKFWYGYHKDAHTSVVGIRELAYGQHHCFENDDEVEAWLESPTTTLVNRHSAHELGLFAYPGQSNMSGRRLPFWWLGRMRESLFLQNTYTLFDAAALAMTSDMKAVFDDVELAPDFTCLSLYKIFGFPDLGALIVRKQSGHILALRGDPNRADKLLNRYFGGGTISMVNIFGEAFHHSKGLQAPTYSLHEGLEDGTLPFHSILALGEAIDVHKRLYGSMSAISAHTTYLICRVYRGLTELRHANGRPVCHIYSESGDDFADSSKQGSAIAFNILKADGQYVPYVEVETSANAAGIYLRSGGVCNPGGIFTALGYEPWMTERMMSAGHHCGSHGISVIHRLPTGIVRASVGAMTTKQEVDTFLDFMRTTFVEAEKDCCSACVSSRRCSSSASTFVQSLEYATKVQPDVRELPRPRPLTYQSNPFSLPVPVREASTGLAVVR